MKNLPNPGALRIWLHRAWRKRHDALGILYRRWLTRHFPENDHTAQVLSERARQIKSTPCIALAMAVYNPPVEFLRQAIQSVKRQTYPHWQLCICDDASSDPAIGEALQREAMHDSRIRIVTRSTNGHICRATNDAISLADSEWIGFLDHDDALVPYALGLVAEAIAARPHAELLYTDEDKLDNKGLRSRPHFKPGWNPALLLGQNYLCHLSIYKLERVRLLGGLRPGFEGAQDHDLALRYMEGLQTHQIVHLPHILYHWRMHSQSTAQRASAKPYAVDAAHRAIGEALVRRDIKASVQPVAAWWQVQPAIRLPSAPVHLMVNSAQGGGLLLRCLDSLLRNTQHENMRVTITIEDRTWVSAKDLTALEELGKRSNTVVRVLADTGTPTELRHKATQCSDAPYMLFLDEAIEVISPHWLYALLGWAEQHDVAAVGAALWSPQGRLLHGGLRLNACGGIEAGHLGLWRGDPGEHGRAMLPQDVMACSGACLLVRRSAFDEVGGLDAHRFPDALADVDLCLRLRGADWRVIWSPASELLLRRGTTRGMPMPHWVHARHPAWLLLRSQHRLALTADPWVHPSECRQGESVRRSAHPRTAQWELGLPPLEHEQLLRAALRKGAA